MKKWVLKSGSVYVDLYKLKSWGAWKMFVQSRDSFDGGWDNGGLSLNNFTS